MSEKTDLSGFRRGSRKLIQEAFIYELICEETRSPVNPHQDTSLCLASMHNVGKICVSTREWLNPVVVLGFTDVGQSSKTNRMCRNLGGYAHIESQAKLFQRTSYYPSFKDKWIEIFSCLREEVEWR